MKIRNQTEDFYLALGLPDDSEVEINDVLGEDDNMTLSSEFKRSPRLH